jgi:hypothetical protein
MDIQYHYMCEGSLERAIMLECRPTDATVTDALTKAFGKNEPHSLCNGLDLSRCRNRIAVTTVNR